MILTPTTKLQAGRFRAILRVDEVEYHLAGLHDSEGDAIKQARALMLAFRNDIKAKLKCQSLFSTATRAGINSKVTS